MNKFSLIIYIQGIVSNSDLRIAPNNESDNKKPFEHLVNRTSMKNINDNQDMKLFDLSEGNEKHSRAEYKRDEVEQLDKETSLVNDKDVVKPSQNTIGQQNLTEAMTTKHPIFSNPDTNTTRVVTPKNEGSNIMNFGHRYISSSSMSSTDNVANIYNNIQTHISPIHISPVHSCPHMSQFKSSPLIPHPFITSPEITPPHFTPPHLIPHHITTPHMTSHQFPTHHITPHYLTIPQFTPHHMTPHHMIPHHMIPHHMTPHHFTPHHFTPRHLAPNHLTPLPINPQFIPSQYIFPTFKSSQFITPPFITPPFISPQFIPPPYNNLNKIHMNINYHSNK